MERGPPPLRISGRREPRSSTTAPLPFRPREFNSVANNALVTRRIVRLTVPRDRLAFFRPKNRRDAVPWPRRGVALSWRSIEPYVAASQPLVETYPGIHPILHLIHRGTGKGITDIENDAGAFRSLLPKIQRVRNISNDSDREKRLTLYFFIIICDISLSFFFYISVENFGRIWRFKESAQRYKDSRDRLDSKTDIRSRKLFTIIENKLTTNSYSWAIIRLPRLILLCIK